MSEVLEGQKYAYQSTENVTWTLEEVDFGKRVHLKEFPAGLELKLFRIATSAGSTELIVTSDHARRCILWSRNDESSLDAEAVRFAQGFRWSDHARRCVLWSRKVEQLHREVGLHP